MQKFIHCVTAHQSRDDIVVCDVTNCYYICR